MEQDGSIEDLLKENLRLTRENNRLLKKIRRAEFLSAFSTIAFYAIVIGVPVFVYRYYLADYMAGIEHMYREVREQMQGVKELSTSVLPGMREHLENLTEETSR